VHHGEVEIRLVGQERAGRPGLGLTLGAQTDVHPTGEQVLGVPGGLAVSQEDQIGHGRSVAGHPGRAQPLRTSRVGPLNWAFPNLSEI